MSSEPLPCSHPSPGFPRPRKTHSAWQGVLGAMGGWLAAMGGSQGAEHRCGEGRGQDVRARLKHMQGGAWAGPTQLWGTEWTGWALGSALTPGSRDSGTSGADPSSELGLQVRKEEVVRLSGQGVEGIRAP